MEEDFVNKPRDLQIPSHAIWTMQHTGGIPTMDQLGPYGTYRHVLHR